ncbi:hypothetical protein PIB30_080671 [Stylosanthes scabra]|uniref:Uncharacterized protein n=1 Tax=Stylosanthes scabra TaxID=79078 RepID=A0ABU6UQB1_9FABA|nr:hypothetical protein [Stylosanthes scabra]
MELLEEMSMKIVLGCSTWQWNRLSVQVELGVQGVDSEYPESTPPFKMNFKGEVNEGIYGINFPASDNSGLSVVKGCPRNTHVVKYRHMMITWKPPPPIIMIEQALGRYVASSGKYVLGVIRDIYWIGRVGYYNRSNELISHRDRHTSYAFV